MQDYSNQYFFFLVEDPSFPVPVTCLGLASRFCTKKPGLLTQHPAGKDLITCQA
jgi:hypothetical protein